MRLPQSIGVCSRYCNPDAWNKRYFLGYSHRGFQGLIHRILQEIGLAAKESDDPTRHLPHGATANSVQPCRSKPWLTLIHTLDAPTSPRHGIRNPSATKPRRRFIRIIFT